MDFETYLRNALDTGGRGVWPDHALRVSEDIDGNLKFYIHALGKNSLTKSYWIKGNQLEFMDLEGEKHA
jgi:hypothetical protein